MWGQNQLDLMQVLIVVMADNLLKENVDAIYLVGTTPDNQESVIARGAQLYHEGQAQKLYLLGGDLYISPQVMDGKIAYSGFDTWQRCLETHGVRSDDILSVSRRAGLIHTGMEVEAVVALAKKEEWQSLLLVAWPAHLLRAFTNTVTFVVRSYPELKVYAVPGVSQPWNELVASSQGNVFGTRIEAIKGELERLNRWHEKGDLISCEEVLEYLKHRDE